jgi:hypothetical protein
VADDFRSSIWFAIAFGYFVVIGAALGFITDQESSGTTRWLAGASWLGGHPAHRLRAKEAPREGRQWTARVE